MILINPYYSYYEAHWNGLDFLGKELTTDSTITDLIDKTVEYYLSLDQAKCFVTVDSYKRICAYVLNQQTKCGVSNCLTNLSYLQKRFYNEFLTVCCINIEVITEFLVDLEKRILISELSEKEREILLIITSVGKSSSDYWNYQIKNFDLSPWKKFISNVEKMKLKLPSWLVADAAGAAAGSLAGAGMGLGVGSIPGAVVGAVIGGVSASAVEAISKD